MSDLYFQDKDRFLVNRSGVSGYMEAKTIKDIVNPVGTITQPKIIKPTEDQGFPVNSSSIIEVIGDRTSTTITLKLLDLQDLDLLGNEGDPIPNAAVTSTSSYTPITTSINSVVSTGGNRYDVKFATINYDFSLFEVGEDLFLPGLPGTTYKLVGITPLEGIFTIESATDFTTNIGNKLESQRSIVATGEVVKYYTHDPLEFDYRCDLVNVTGTWLPSPYNNRRQMMTFDTIFPKGGQYVDINSARFEAEAFECLDSDVLQLTQVLWRLNGTEFDVPVVNKNGPQYWDVPSSEMDEGQINTVTVVYKAGQNSSLDINNPNTVNFIPKTIISRNDALLNTVEDLSTQVTELGL